MVKKVLLDTSILIDHLLLTFKDNNAVTVYMRLKAKNVKCFIAGVTIAELYAGKSTLKKEEAKRVKSLLEEVQVVLPNKVIYRLAGELARDYQPLILVDALVAASAMKNGSALMTLNDKYFKNIKGLELFSSENLYKLMEE